MEYCSYVSSSPSRSYNIDDRGKVMFQLYFIAFKVHERGKAFDAHVILYEVEFSFHAINFHKIDVCILSSRSS